MSDTNRDAGRSLAFHAELGFVEVGTRDTDDGVTVAMLAKPLAAT